MLSHSGERIEINVIDSSDIRAAIEELKNIQENLKKSILVMRSRQWKSLLSLAEGF